MPITTGKIKRVTIASFAKNMEQLEFSYTTDESKNKNNLAVSYKIKHVLITRGSNSTPRRNENTSTQTTVVESSLQLYS